MAGGSCCGVMAWLRPFFSQTLFCARMRVQKAASSSALKLSLTLTQTCNG